MSKTLSELLYQVPLLATSGNMGQPIEGLAFDSRSVLPGYAFVALKGTRADGHDFIEQAIRAGARAVVCEQMPSVLYEDVAYIQVTHTAEALGSMAAAFYDYPSRKLKVVGITGTNGKTTTATLLYNLFSRLGYTTGLISTVVNRVGEQVLAATHTTPDALSLQSLLARMRQAGCTHVFMEVSSHALDQRRTAGLEFTGAVFTNISRDHLDYHKTFENYIHAKQRLFNDLPAKAFALSNRDDKRGEYMLQNTRAKRYYFALKRPADFKGRLIENTLEGLHLSINGLEAWYRLAGIFNAYNLTAVVGVALLLGEDLQQVVEVLSELPGAPGRFESIQLGDITAIVDYAHTPDALENVLQTIHALRTSSQPIITVVGCGGNRDKGKRPIMAKISVKWSDQVIFTSDNPRHEDPMHIIQDMLAGVSVSERKKVVVIEDRRAAIQQAVEMAVPGSIILIAGKGHETYQEVGHTRYPFDDRQEVSQCLQLRMQKGQKNNREAKP